jgi:hypothetical protein
VLIPLPGSSTKCVYDQETEKSGKGPINGYRAIIIIIIIIIITALGGVHLLLLSAK